MAKDIDQESHTMRKITQVHEIELTSRCNLACVYCPHPKMRRQKADIEWETYERALEHVDYYCRQNTQGELALTGIGEALLHPRFVEALNLARKVIGRERKLTFSTNGILLTQDICQAIKDADPIVFVSMHRPEAAGPAIELLRKNGLFFGVNDSFVTSALNWTGDVDWHVSHSRQECAYLRDGWCVVRADGTVGTCCWDAESVRSRIGHVRDEFGSFVTAPHEACRTCSLAVPMNMTEGTLA